MNRPIALIIGLLTVALSAFAEDTKIPSGMPISAVQAALTKNGFSYGPEFGLQWAPPKGCEFLFCRLDEEHTLVVVLNSEKKEVCDLSVHCPAPVMTTRADAVVGMMLAGTYAVHAGLVRAEKMMPTWALQTLLLGMFLYSYSAASKKIKNSAN